MKISVQTGGIVDPNNYEEGYAIIARAGFEAIDWNLDHAMPYPDILAGKCDDTRIFTKSIDEIMAHYEKQLECIKRNGLEITQAHAPFPCYVDGKPFVLDYMIETYKNIILFCDKIGCKNLVIHGHSLAKNSTYLSAEEVDVVNDKLYTSLIPTLRETNVTVCLENLFSGFASGLSSGVCADPREAVEMIDTYNAIAGKECFGFCLDVGHMNLLRYDPRKYMPILGDRIKALHLHDNSGIIDEHKAPYTGTVNWTAVYTTLKEIGYKGDLSFETANQTSRAMLDQELLEPWVTLIAQIGKHFRNKILG